MLNVRQFYFINFLSLFNCIYFSDDLHNIFIFFLNFLISLFYVSSNTRPIRLGTLQVSDRYRDFEPCHWDVVGSIQSPGASKFRRLSGKGESLRHKFSWKLCLSSSGMA